MLRAIVLNMLGMNEDKEIGQEALRKFNSLESIDPDLRTSVYKTVMHNFPTRENFGKLVELYKETEFNEEKVRVLESLPFVSDESLLEEVVAMLVDEKQIKTQDVYIALNSLALNPKGKEKALSFLKQKLTPLHLFHF